MRLSNFATVVLFLCYMVFVPCFLSESVVVRLPLVKGLGGFYIYAPSLTVSVLEYMNSPSAASKDDFVVYLIK